MKENPYNDILHFTQDSGETVFPIVPLTVQKFFNQGNRYIKIPNYQRPYSWTKNNINDLFNDIDKLNEQDSWFLGPTFIVKNSLNLDDIMLLDGQQRVTTITLMLSHLFELITLIKIEFKDTIKSEPEDKQEKYKTLIQKLKILERLLTVPEANGIESRFKSEKDLESIVSEYIINIMNDDNDKKKFKTLFDKFEIKCLKKIDQGYPSAESFIENMKHIKEYFQTKLTEYKGYNIIDYLNSFCTTLLNKLWLIEIPLKNELSSIKIFESINNRGKALTLIDKFRYRTLIDKSIYGDKDKINEISKKWAEIYSLFANTNENEDGFFQYFFISKDGRDISKSKHEKFFEIFEKEYSNDSTKVFRFLEEVKYFLSFLNACKSPNSAEENFLQGDLAVQKGRDRSILLGLFELSRRCIEYNENSKFLFFKSLRFNKSNEWGLIIEMEKINRYIFWKSFQDQTKSNEIRNQFLELCKSKKSLKSILKDRDLPNKVNSLQNKLISNDNKVCYFIILYYTHLTEPELLVQYNAEIINKSEVEHLMPRAWKKNWKDAENYNKAKCEIYLDNIKNDFPLFNIEEFKIYISNEETEFEPKNYDDGQGQKASINTNTIIEYIGNRWVLSKAKNRIGRNKKFTDKKIDYNNAGLSYPSNSSDIGIDNYYEFDAEDIILRSLKILDKLYKSLSGKRQWNE